MKKIFFMTTILVVFLFVPLIASANVIINEIMYDLETGPDTDREWIEILNYSDTSIDLTGWKFYENNTNHGLTVIQGGTIIPSNGYAIIADKSDKFLLDNPGYLGILFDSAFSLSNDGENLAIKNKELTIIDELNYYSSWGANGNGQSLQRKNSIENSNDPTNWGTGTPTPGLINNISPEESEEPASTSEEPTSEPTTPIGNNPLIADAGDNIIAFTGQEIKFDGSKSSDPNNSELAYSWNMGDGKLIEQKSFTYKYNYPGTYLVTLMVYNGRNYASETITIKIQPQQITINEFLPNPSGKDEEEEWSVPQNNGLSTLSSGPNYYLGPI